jgi:hypothetical protein
MQRREGRIQRGWGPESRAGARFVGGKSVKGRQLQWFVGAAAALCLLRLLSSYLDFRTGRAGPLGSDGMQAQLTPLPTARFAAADYLLRLLPSPPPTTAPRAVGVAASEPPLAVSVASLPHPPSDSCRTCATASMLTFNSHARALFTRIDGSQNRGLFVTFGSLGMQEFILNWVAQVTKQRLGPFLVGALDDGAAELCEQRGIPAVSFGALTMNTTGAYWRQNERTFLAMATLKTQLLIGLLTSGWDCMMSDVDVLWFDSPWGWLGGHGVQTYPEAAKMIKADVLISTDIVEVETDSEHASWLLNREYNTGIVFFRATNASVALVRLWRERCDIEGAIEGLYINDQAVFNRMTHGSANGRTEELVLSPEEEPDLLPNAVRGVFHVTSPIMAPSGLRVAMGVLPMTRFCNGHVFFINRLPSRFGLKPIAVHATYQYADEKTYSYGKRHRLRQARGWNMDTDAYYTEGQFLVIAGDSLMAGVQYRRDELAVWRGKNFRKNNGIALHFSMEATQRELLRDAFALAIALNRTLVLPDMLCFCDRYWWLTHACRMPGAESMPLPLACPLDHLYDIGRWYEQGLSFREAGFMGNPRVPLQLKRSRARLRVTRSAGATPDARARAAPEYDDGQPPSTEVAIAEGLTLDGAAVLLRAAPGGTSRVLEVDAHDLQSFCGFAQQQRTEEVDSRLFAAFAIGVNVCGEEDNILPERDWDPVAMPLNCTKGYNPPRSISERTREKSALCARRRV